MNVVTELKKERERLAAQLARLDQAIVLLGIRVLNGRPKKHVRRWSAASRAKQAARMRALWKQGRFKK